MFFAAALVISTTPSAAANCALYVRSMTGVALYGAADEWWNQAEGRYARGYLPAIGAILVFRRTGHMRSGHVALVTKIISPREILIDHANWYHGSVSHGMSVIDTSPNHDWTTVAVMELRAGKHGRDNPTFGFIYPAVASSGEPGLLRVAATAEFLDGGGESLSPRAKRGRQRPHQTGD